jgi:hypothetical protein
VQFPCGTDNLTTQEEEKYQQDCRCSPKGRNKPGVGTHSGKKGKAGKQDRREKRQLQRRKPVWISLLKPVGHGFSNSRHKTH